jgi:hypothetical protein
VLVRYNPESDEAMNRRQAARLRKLADYVHESGQHFMFELLVPITHEQSDRLEGDQHLYDHDLRPSLMIGAIKELQNPPASSRMCGRSRGWIGATTALRW